MRTNGPDQRDCDACGKPLGNRIRITLVDGRVVGICCPLSETEQAVNGWKQAIGIIAKQQKALMWYEAEIQRLALAGKIEKSPERSREYVEIVQPALNIGGEYLYAMRQAGVV